ncbi:MAG: site-specific integrase [Eubacteriales bacterium]|nr:site-specific integrase [Eubacteriales bacterium]
MISAEFEEKIWVYYETNLLPATRKKYWNIIRNFDKVIGHDPLRLTLDESKEYYNYLINRINNNNLSYSTAVTRLSTIRSICDFIENYSNAHGLKYTNFFKEISLPEEDKTIEEEDIPTIKEIDSILKVIKKNKDDKAFLIISLVVKCALTNNEISGLNYENIVMDTLGNLCINIPPKGRGRVSRFIKLSDDVARLLDKYINENSINTGPIFINKRKSRIKPRDTQRMMEKYCDICIKEKKIKRRYTMQSLRHAAFTYMLKGGATKEQLADYAGITTKWMTRYEKILTSGTVEQAIDYSIITIKSI